MFPSCCEKAYPSQAACENGIRRDTAKGQPQRFESFRKSGQHGFNHVAANGEIIGRSEKYTTAQARDHGIQVVLREAPGARLEDLS